IDYITKLKFLLYFKVTFNILIIKNNILEDFLDTSLVLVNLETIILKLNIYL
ncbi:hypothetical protein GQ44DRAFT_553164, partial [Phaeosphaeriaceae sp. PMI808]